MKNEYTIREDGVAEIVLTQGKVALVDVDDLPLLADHRWHASCCHGKYWYVKNGNRRLMHRLLLNAPGDVIIDHVNHSGLDNRRSNIRICTTAENGANSRRREGTSSKYKGVTWFGRDEKWLARISHERTDHCLGLFESERAAARAYDTAARQKFGVFACLNFPAVEQVLDTCSQVSRY